MSDKLKQLRDDNPVVDFAAGFIPGVGEVQDAHDFYHAAKQNDFGGMALASLGLIIPGFTGGQISKGFKFAKKLAKNSDEVINVTRKFAKASDAPVYDALTAPKKLKLSSRDITEMHLNDGSSAAKHTYGKELISDLNKQFAEADHGTAIRIGNDLDDANHGLSSSSAPIFYKMSRRWAKQGKGGYFVPQGEPEMVKMNKIAQHIAAPGKQVSPPFDQKLVDELNKEIKSINEMGYNFPEARLEKFKNPFPKNHPQHEWFEKTNKHKGILLIPNIGFLKYKYGGQINNRRLSSKNIK